MSERQDPREGISAAVPYLRHDLEVVHVEYTARILGADTIEPHTLPIRNGRAAARPPTYEREGLQLCTWPSRVAVERRDELTADKELLEMRPAEHDYWDETIPLVRELSGARTVLPVHASTVRFSASSRVQGRMTPAGWAHVDYGPDEAKVQLEETLAHARGDVPPFRRYALYQGWRALSDPPQDFPLAICDARTVRDADMIPLEYHVRSDQGDVTYRSRGARYSDRHQWWYFPDMAVDEMIVFSGFDSDAPDARSTLHVAVEDTTVVDAVPRVSMETRYFALFD